MKVLDIYERATKVPVLGRGAFSLAIGLTAPYFLTISPTLVDLRPNHAAVRVRKWWGVQNHLGTVHVIAVANGLEMAMGVLAEATRADGAVVVRGVIRLHVSEKRHATTVSAAGG
jgi:hypothetical protein